jgi:hypothetical protein
MEKMSKSFKRLKADGDGSCLNTIGLYCLLGEAEATGTSIQCFSYSAYVSAIQRASSVTK